MAFIEDRAFNVYLFAGHCERSEAISSLVSRALIARLSVVAVEIQGAFSPHGITDTPLLSTAPADVDMDLCLTQFRYFHVNSLHGAIALTKYGVQVKYSHGIPIPVPALQCPSERSKCNEW